MNPGLLIFQPRAIQAALDSIAALPYPKVRLVAMTEMQLPPAIRQACDEATVQGLTHLTLICDDCVVPPESLELIHAAAKRHPDRIISGWCRLDETNPLSNLSNRPIVDAVFEYDFIPVDEIRASKAKLIPTRFCGLPAPCFPVDVLREHWPARPYGNDPGWASDLKLSFNLQQAGIPVFAHRDAEIIHLKEEWNRPDRAHEKRLLVGIVPPEVRWDDRRGDAVESVSLQHTRG